MAYNYPNYYPQYGYPQSYAANPTSRAMEWVEGEVGAKAFQMPAGWPVNTPIALWDSTEKKVFLKSWNQMGMANPLQELDYTIKENPAMLSGATQEQYVTKQDLEELRNEIKNISSSMNSLVNQRENNRNRGGQQ